MCSRCHKSRRVRDVVLARYALLRSGGRVRAEAVLWPLQGATSAREGCSSSRRVPTSPARNTAANRRRRPSQLLAIAGGGGPAVLGAGLYVCLGRLSVAHGRPLSVAVWCRRQTWPYRDGAHTGLCRSPLSDTLTPPPLPPDLRDRCNVCSPPTVGEVCVCVYVRQC